MYKRSPSRCVDRVFRHQWISVAAYYKTETRNFEPGMELDDWLYAELNYVKMQIVRYLAITKEDGGRTITGLQRLANSVGVDDADSLYSKIELIQAIQQATKNDPCFRTTPITYCAENECVWKEECKTMIAKWCQ